MPQEKHDSSGCLMNRRLDHPSRACVSAPEGGDAVVLFFSDIRIYREALEFGLTHTQGITLAGHCRCSEALARLAETRVDIALVDASDCKGLQLGRQLRARFPRLAILGLAISGESGRVVQCAEAGFSGYLSADAGIAGLLTAIAEMGRGEIACSPRVARMMFDRLASLAASGGQEPAPPDPERGLYVQTNAATDTAIPITPRESEIAQLIEAGLTNKEIAIRLSISASTVKNHVHSMLEKLSAPRRAAIGTKLAKLAPHHAPPAQRPWSG